MIMDKEKMKKMEMIVMKANIIVLRIKYAYVIFNINYYSLCS